MQTQLAKAGASSTMSNLSAGTLEAVLKNLTSAAASGANRAAGVSASSSLVRAAERRQQQPLISAVTHSSPLNVDSQTAAAGVAYAALIQVRLIGFTVAVL